MRSLSGDSLLPGISVPQPEATTVVPDKLVLRKVQGKQIGPTWSHCFCIVNSGNWDLEVIQVEDFLA